MLLFPDLPELRPLKAIDAEWLEELHAQCFDEYERWPEDLFEKFLQTPAAFGIAATIHGQPGGFILGQKAADEAEIVTIAVLPYARRRGLGTFLTEAFCNLCHSQKAEKIFLEVAQDNTSAILLYKKLGFSKAGRRPDYYKKERGSVDALIMQKSLPA
ncbi:MAG TPA: ribosomal protein S18-alanine N-acetyltransferase [Alphaproteobacteria bacterium]|nr:ribosomal protein S18-alanine N-acetyltransferase [Alphaproteobacteria bacterium]